MSYFVCATFDIFDPVTGFFVMKMDCIEWNEDDLGSWEGPKYSSKEECYARSICTQGDNNPTDIPSNNFCGISISNIRLINRTEETLTFNITLPESYENTFIEYAFYDIEYNQLRDFQFVCNTPNPLPLSGTFTIQDNFTNVCAIAFRLHVACFEQCPPRTLIPVEDSGGEGSAGGHWENAARNIDYPTPDGAYYPGISDIMNSGGSSVSTSLSVACLQDMGYVGSPGYIFDRCSWSNIESSEIPNIQDVFEWAASEWEKYLSYDPSVFALIKATIDPTPLTPIGPQNGSEGGSESGSGCGDGTWNGLRIDGYYESDFGSDAGFIAACGIYSYVNLDNGIGIKNNSASCFIIVNTHYNVSEEYWKEVMLHEFGHALGIGTLWSGNEDFWLTKEDYPLAFEVYNSLSGSSCPPGDNCIDNDNDNITIIDDSPQRLTYSLDHNHDEHCNCGNKSVLAGWKPQLIGTFTVK